MKVLMKFDQSIEQQQPILNYQKQNLPSVSESEDIIDRRCESLETLEKELEDKSKKQKMVTNFINAHILDYRPGKSKRYIV